MDTLGKQADKYYGRAASGYEAQRSVKAMWQREHQVVGDMLEGGPVIDLPCGTGRFFSIYRAKGLEFTGVDISMDMLHEARKSDPLSTLAKGSVFDYAPERGHATAVCVRLMHWLTWQEVEVAFSRLATMAPTLIISIGLGDHRKVTSTYDHDQGKWHNLIGEKWTRTHLQDNPGRNVWWMYRIKV